MIVTGCVLVDLHQHSGASRSVASRHHYCGFQTAMRSSTCPPANTKTQHNVSQQRLFVTSSLRMTRADRRRRTADVAQVWWFFSQHHIGPVSIHHAVSSLWNVICLTAAAANAHWGQDRRASGCSSGCALVLNRVHTCALSVMWTVASEQITKALSFQTGTLFFIPIFPPVSSTGRTGLPLCSRCLRLGVSERR